jgi:hypothetical protein
MIIAGASPRRGICRPITYMRCRRSGSGYPIGLGVVGLFTENQQLRRIESPA